MFPYRDDNPTLATPIITIFLIGANVAVWVLIQGMGSDPRLAQSICELGLIPAEFLGRVLPGTSVPLSPTATCVRWSATGIRRSPRCSCTAAGSI